MDFEAFAELYTNDVKNRLKENTWLTKEHIIRTKILPYFGKMKISGIGTKEIIAWQNELLAYRDEKRNPYSQTYLKTVHNQLSAIFNHAVRYYDLCSNPAAKAGNMGSEEHKEMLFWTKEEYKKFADEMMDKPVSFYAFEMLYWCGIRKGELLALTAADFNFDKETVTINKSYQRLHGEDVITSPKTKKSNGTIKMPRFLCEEMQEYISMLYGLKKKDRIFTVTKSYLHHEMDRGAKAAGVKRIRIHDLRHSHISLLIDMGFSAVAIADRVGHESIEITYRYTRVSLKQALAAQGFKGGSRGDMEWSRWVQSEKEQLAAVMERHGIEWEHKGTHQKHLSVLDYKKQEPEKEVVQLAEQIAEKKEEIQVLSNRVQNYDKGMENLKTLEQVLDTSSEYQLPEPQGLMSAKSYKNKVAEPLIQKLKSLVKTALIRCFEAYDSYYQLNITNSNLHRENDRLTKTNEKLAGENEYLRAENRNYKLLKKSLGSKQMDNLLEQAKAVQQSKQRGKRFRNNQEKR